MDLPGALSQLARTWTATRTTSSPLTWPPVPDRTRIPSGPGLGERPAHPGSRVPLRGNIVIDADTARLAAATLITARSRSGRRRSRLLWLPTPHRAVCYDASSSGDKPASGSSDAVPALSRPADAAIFEERFVVSRTTTSVPGRVPPSSPPSVHGRGVVLPRRRGHLRRRCFFSAGCITRIVPMSQVALSRTTGKPGIGGSRRY